MRNKDLFSYGFGLALAAGCLSAPVHAIDLTADDWTFSVNGNINVNYIYSHCQSSTTAEPVAGGLACEGTPSSTNVSNVANGLLPAAIVFGIKTTQNGFDIAGHFGLYPGIATNDGGSPNLQQGSPAGTNVALGTTGLDVRQVYVTVGNNDIGTFTLGRNFGLFGFDAIINDITIRGVGGGGAASGSAPANTTLGSIGLGYIYVDTLGQINYTTPTFSGFNLTLGIFDPLNALTTPSTTVQTAAGPSVVADTNAPKGAPGFHGKATYTLNISDGVKLYVSGTAIAQRQDFTTAVATAVSYTGWGTDGFVKLDIHSFEFAGSYYHASGLGTTAFFDNSSDSTGKPRESDGYLVQGTYTTGPVKFGLNYGVSKLNVTNTEDAIANPNLVGRNSKVTFGVYYSLTKSLTLESEVTNVQSTAHDGDQNKSTNANIGAFFAF